MPEAQPYRPKLNASLWEQVDEHVLATVAAAVRSAPYSEGDLMQSYSRLAAWARETNRPLDASSLLSEASIANYLSEGLPTYSDASKGNRRSQLRAIRTALDGTATSNATPLASADPSVPYTPAEIAKLRTWADAQLTNEARRDAASMLSLGLGAGLSAGEIADIRAADVRVTTAGVQLGIYGKRPRTVQVRRQWEAPLIDHIEHIAEAEYLIRAGRKTSSRNFANNVVERSDGPAFRPQSQRMRATWIVTHLTLGTPVGVLMDAAGVLSLEAFTRYVQFLPPVAEKFARALLRGD